MTSQLLASSTTSSQAPLPPPSLKTASRQPDTSTMTSQPPASSTTSSPPPSLETASQWPDTLTITSQPPASSTTSSQAPPPPPLLETALQRPDTSTMTSQPPAASITTLQQLAVSAEMASQVLAAPEKAAQKKRKFVNDSSDDEEQQELSSAQLLLFKKGKKLQEILLDPQINDEIPTNSEHLKLKLVNIMTELSAMPIKVTDVKTAENRILQWKKQELQYENLSTTAESYNLLHLMSLVQIYEDVIKVGKELEKDPKMVLKM